MIGMADCASCGVRMPLREAFSNRKLIAHAMRPGSYQALRGPCPCGGVLVEDVEHTLRLVREFAERGDPE